MSKIFSSCQSFLASQSNSAVPSATKKAEKSTDKVDTRYQVRRRHVSAFCDIRDPQEVKWRRSSEEMFSQSMEKQV